MGLLEAGDQKIYVHLLRPGVSTVEAYHLSRLLGYAQQHAIRKQVLTDWKDLFEEGVDYEISHDPDVITEYEHAFRDHFGTVKFVKPSRGRIFLTWSGIKKVLEHTTKECNHILHALEGFFGSDEPASRPAKKKKVPPVPQAAEKSSSHSRNTFLEWLEESVPRAAAEKSSSSSRNAAPDLVELKTEEAPRPPSRWRQYQILETLIDHLKNTRDPAIRTLALMSAETGLGRPLDDIRALLEPEESPQAAATTPDVKPVVVSSAPVSSNRAAGPLFQDIPNVYYGLKQIGEMAGGYSAVQAGKAADLVAERMGHSHEDIRRKKLPFNDLPQLPDSTSGKLRQMYRFNADFSNQVVFELRVNPTFEPSRAPDLTSFSQGGSGFPKLSRGPFDD